MTNDDKNQTDSAPGEGAASDDTAQKPASGTGQSGPQFTPGPDPLAGVKKGAANLLDSMEGKTVSMKVYVGSIIAVIVLMMLARCGG